MQETNCLVINDLVTWKKLNAIIGEQWWNEVESIICIPTNALSKAEVDAIVSFIPKLHMAQYIIVELNKINFSNN